LPYELLASEFKKHYSHIQEVMALRFARNAGHLPQKEKPLLHCAERAF